MRYLTCACLFLHKRVSPLVSPVHITRAPTTKLPTSNSEINYVNSDAKHVSKVQRFILPLKIQPISVHKEKNQLLGLLCSWKKINHGSCQWSHYPLGGGVPPSYPPLHVDISSIELHFHKASVLVQEGNQLLYSLLFLASLDPYYFSPK